MNDEDDILAAELAFGLLSDDERHMAKARAAADPAFAAMVARWADYAAALAAGAGEAPRPSLWPAIEARLPANDTASAGPGVWRIIAIAASLLAAVMTVVAIERRPAAPVAPASVAAPPPLVAMLSGANRQGVIAISFDPSQQALTLQSAAFDPGRHSAELWVIPADKKPQSLGVIDPATPRTRLSRTLAASAIVPGVTLAVSIEPLGGSPTGQPTGPVVLSGIVQKS